MTHWRILNTDILTLRTDGLICSANPALNMSGGVGGAMLLRYGPEMQEWLYAHLRSSGCRYLEPGEVAVAPGTPYKAVAHAVAVDAFYDTSTEIIRRAYENALGQLASAGCHTVAAACLGCGYGRCPVEDFITAIKPLVEGSLPGIERVTLATTNEDLAAAIGAVIALRKA